MSPPATFSHHVARLVWLLVYRPTLTEEHKEALRSVLVEGRAGRHVITLAELNRAIADAVGPSVLPPAMPWLNELAARMAAHSVAALEFAEGVKAADVLGVARVLASAPAPGDEGANFDARALALQLTTISVKLGRVGFVRRPTPIAMTRVSLSAPDGAPRRTSEASAPPMPAADLGRASDQREIEEAAFAPRGSDDAIAAALRQLDGALTPELASRVLSVLLRACDDRARAGKWEEVAHSVQLIIAREATITDDDLKRAFAIQVRRALRPETLRGLAQLLGKRRDLRPALESIFVRAGEAGVEMLIEQMVASNAATERRAYRSALARCPAAATPLTHLLEDARWYVVRNAAELLGELGVREADAQLMTALRHSDARVRRSAAAALARLGTSRGIIALQPLLSDSNAAVRLQAVHGLSAARLPRSVPALMQALEREGDAEVQHALVAALGAHPTDASVERLVRLAQPGTLLNRRAAPLRVAAVNALGEAATHAALSALRQLQRDRERAVRQAAERALAERAQGELAGR